MKNAAALPLLLLFPLLSFAMNNPQSSTFFHKGDLDKIKTQASEEGKLYFVDFYADYCYACKLMDETTFVDPKLANYVKNTYIPYKVDVMMDFDGIAMKDEYKITVLPTILVFNSKGDLVGRYESMLGPTRMIKELQKYDIPENRVKSGNAPVEEPVLAFAPGNKKPTQLNINKLTTKINTAPDRAINITNERINGHATTFSEPKDQIANQTFGSSNTKEHEKQTTDTSKETLAAEPKKIIPKKYDAPEPKKVAKPATITGDDKKTEGLFQFTVKPYKNEGYGVQIGVFAQYGNVLREVQKLQDKFSQPILVNISTLNDVVVYKIIVGSFGSTREAVAFRRMMQKKGTDGVIKDLSTIQM